MTVTIRAPISSESQNLSGLPLVRLSPSLVEVGLSKQVHNYGMTSTSRAIISTILANDVEIADHERAGLIALLGISAAGASSYASAGVSLSQEQVAAKLGISRTTAWRMKECGILKPVEISPGIERYYLQDIEALARDGYRARISRRPKLAA